MNHEIDGSDPLVSLFTGMVWVDTRRIREGRIVFCVKLGSGCGALSYWRGRVNSGEL